ncbi:hypothetical protein B0H21DRAFT_745466 [Amylocystis lapponica]|nr:hypothetical protein B0H21DRAFT_745466 [Amylocystis lapponica]
MASAHQSSHVYSVPPPPNLQLPSIKDLNFPYSRPPNQDDAPSQNGSIPPGHSRPPRHDNTWSRSTPSSAPAPNAQHPSSMSAPHESPKAQYPPQKPDATYMASGVPMSQQAGQGMAGSGSGAGAPRDAPSQNSGKRPRSGSVVSASPGRSHNTYPPPSSYSSQPPPPSFQQGPPVPIPPSHDGVHAPPGYTHPPPGYAYPPPHMVPRHYAVPPPPGVHQNPPVNSFPPPMPPEHWQHPPPPPQQGQHQYNGFPRTTALVPANVDARNAPSGDMEKANARQGTIQEVWRITAAHTSMQPSYDELQDMTYHATTVVRLLEDLQVAKENARVPLSNSEEQSRPPKRPWEDMSREEGTVQHDAPFPDHGGNAPGQPKSKYRKRSRATPPGKCHSCNIRETPEWRRGPDGARTLCNACGLHYAKLMRKRDKGADGKPTPIDMQTLRASTASARGSDPAEQSHSQSQQHQSSSAGPSSYEQKQPSSMSHHAAHPAGPYQLMPMMPPPPPPASHSDTGVPPPPWMTSSSSSGRGGYGADHQSYMRASHPPSHARASPPQ